jgi:RimJ/RimL family protein N-acetyltransferase
VTEPFVPPPDPRPLDPPWPQAVWPPAPGTVLRGRTVELTLSDPSRDADGLFVALDHDQVWAHVAGRPADVEAMAALIRTKLADPAWWPWTVRLVRPLGGFDACDVVGTSSYLEIDAGAARGEIGSTTYAPTVWATEVNPECKLLLLAYVFEQCRFGRVQLKTDIRNERSQRAIARLGAQHEGVLRRYQRRSDGSIRDSVLFSITAEEWPAVRAGLVARLGPTP